MERKDTRNITTFGYCKDDNIDNLYLKCDALVLFNYRYFVCEPLMEFWMLLYWDIEDVQLDSDARFIYFPAIII